MSEITTDSSANPLLSLFLENFEAAGGVILYPQKGESIQKALTHMVKAEGVRYFAISSDVPNFNMVSRLLEGLGLERPQRYQALDLGITRAHGAGASTGTLVFVFSEGRDHLLTSLPRVHLAVLRREDLHENVSHATISFLKDPEGPPPYVSLVTGPSRTGDIELTHVTGVHGPEKLYLVVVS